MTLNAIIANFQTFKLVDLLDIIIISFLIYQLLGIVNRTRAGQLFKGCLLYTSHSHCSYFEQHRPGPCAGRPHDELWQLYEPRKAGDDL